MNISSHFALDPCFRSNSLTLSLDLFLILNTQKFDELEAQEVHNNSSNNSEHPTQNKEQYHSYILGCVNDALAMLSKRSKSELS